MPWVEKILSTCEKEYFYNSTFPDFKQTALHKRAFTDNDGLKALAGSVSSASNIKFLSSEISLIRKVALQITIEGFV
jgi:hypothetical protein